MTDKHELARSILAAEINKRQDELIALEASFAEMGGSFDGDEAPATKQKLLTGPKAKKARKKKGKRKTAPPPGSQRDHCAQHQWPVH